MAVLTVAMVISQLPDSFLPSIMLNLKDILKLIPDASDVELQKLLKATQCEVDARKNKNFVDYIPSYCDEELIAAVLDECESLSLADNGRKAAAQWLSPVNEPYIYIDANPIHHAIDINNFPSICRVLKMVNSDPRFHGELDSCLVLKYSSKATSVSLHADDEESIDQAKSICNFSIGSTRTLEFWSKDDNKHVTSICMESGSVTHMKPGTQQALKHMVRGTKSKKDSPDVKPHLRFSLSFRALARRSAPAEPLPDAGEATPKVSQQVPVSQPPRRVCLVAGDSYAERLDTARLGRNVRVVESVAKGGAKIGHVIQQLEDYSRENSGVVVEKLLISVGTNNLRNCHSGVEHLRKHFKSLCEKINELFPNSKVYFQSLIPLPCLNRYDWNTNRNVMDFNKIIFNECIYRKFYILSAFEHFSVPWNGMTPDIRNNRFFVGRNIHPSEKVGLGVLAKLYIRAIHSNYFIPYVLQ